MTGTVVTASAVANFQLDLKVVPPVTATFAANAGFTFSAPTGLSNGALFSVTAPSGIMGAKPFSPQPLFWLPADTSGNPSPLGRITTLLGSPVNSGQLTFSATGGPNGQGCYQSTVATGAAGVWNWVLGYDITQWSGWKAADPFGGNNGYYINDYGQKMYSYHRTSRTFPHLDGNSLGFNTKRKRVWTTTPVATTGAPQAAPEMYNPPSDQRFATDGTGGSPDYPSGGGNNQGANTTAAVASAENIVNTWYAEEEIFSSNSSATALDANYNWRVPAAPVQGPFAHGSMYNYPVVTYATISCQFLNASCAQTLAGNQRGTMTRFYTFHYVIDGTAGSHTAAPAGAQIFYAEAYDDDSLCRCVATNSATWGAETDFQPQIPTEWNTAASSDTGMFSAYNFPVGWWLYLVNAQGVATQVGKRIA